MKVWILQIPRIDNELSWGLREAANLFEKQDVEVEIINFNDTIYRNFFDTDAWPVMEEFGVLGKGKDNLPMQKIETLFYDAVSKVQPDDIMLWSIFSTESREWFLLLNILFKKRFKNKIAIGGSGCRHPGETGLESEWGDWLMNYKLVDTIFLGESSKTIPEFCQSNFTSTGKLYNQTKQVPGLGFLPKKLLFKDSPFNDPAYKSKVCYAHIPSSKPKDQPAVSIHFTQGCVKKCTFCDVPLSTPIWNMKSADDVLDEIKYYHDLVGATYFNFQDNTINGSTSMFMKFLRLLSAWKDKENIDIAWSGQFACKTKSHFSEEYFNLLAETGAKLAVGFDHCSDNVLDHMKKLYKWHDIEWFILKCQKHKVDLKLAMWIVGYPTETEEDLAEYNKLFDLIKGNELPIGTHQVIPCSIIRNSPLEKIVDIDYRQPNNWTKDALTHDVRLQRKKWIDEKLIALGQGYFKYDNSKLRNSRI